MTELAFFDTNVLLYSEDKTAAAKRERAVALFAEHYAAGAIVISLQVLQEYFSAATQKLHLPEQIAQARVELLTTCQVVRFQPHDIIAAIELHRLTSISFWDALIVHAARISGASVLYSEDLQPGSRIGGVRVVNPFD